MFGEKKLSRQSEDQARIEQLEKEVALLKDKLKSSELELEAVNNSTHLGIWKCFFDENGGQTGVWYSDEFRRMLGYSRMEFADTIEALAGIIIPEDTEMAFGAFAAASGDRSGRTPFDIEYHLKTKSGAYKLFHAAGTCLRFPNGVAKEFIGTIMDIDEQKKNEAIFEHDSRRQKAVEIMMLEGSWSLDLSKYAVDDINAPMVFSDQFKKILGYPPRSPEFPDIMQSWISRMHPDDLPGASAAIGRQLQDSSGSTPFDMEYRLKHKNGEWIWVRASSYVVFSNKKIPLMAAGTILDISEQKKNKQRFEEEMEPNIESLRAGIADIAANVEKATVQMKDVSRKQVEVTGAANEIESAVNASMEIIGSIQTIANRTNLLSLNASIEAARAGDAGRGFAVVATEVQTLSNSTKQTTEHISDKLNNVNESVKGILTKINQISKSIEEENEEMTTINATVEELHAAADEIAKMAESLYQ